MYLPTGWRSVIDSTAVGTLRNVNDFCIVIIVSYFFILLHRFYDYYNKDGSDACIELAQFVSGSCTQG